MTVAPTVHAGLAVYESGSGEAIFMMPGPHQFERPGIAVADALLDGLRGLRRRVITYDPPDSGASTRPARLGMAEMHECADDALDACGVAGPVDAVGHSMGGLAVLAYAIERPERVRRLVLIGTGTGGPAYMRAPGALWNRSHAGFWGVAALGLLQMVVRTRGPEKLMNDYIDRRSYHDRRFVVHDAVSVGDWVRRRQGRTDWHRVAKKLDYRPRLGEIRAPTLILCGRDDPQFPPACSEQLAAGIRDADVVWFERSGHYPFVEEPDAFWAAVGRFLSSERRPTPAHPRATPASGGDQV